MISVISIVTEMGRFLYNYGLKVLLLHQSCKNVRFLAYLYRGGGGRELWHNYGLKESILHVISQESHQYFLLPPSPSPTHRAFTETPLISAPYSIVLYSILFLLLYFVFSGRKSQDPANNDHVPLASSLY